MQRRATIKFAAKVDGNTEHWEVGVDQLRAFGQVFYDVQAVLVRQEIPEKLTLDGDTVPARVERDGLRVPPVEPHRFTSLGQARKKARRMAANFANGAPLIES